MTNSRVVTRVRGLVVVSALALAAAIPALRPAEAVPSYDGVWSVVIVTQQGLCEPSYRYPIRIAKGLAKHPIGVILLARLAVDKQEQGTGLGKALLKDAFLRIASAADMVGARAVLVHAVDERARQFYEHFGFESSPTDPLALMFLMKDLRALLKNA